MDFIAFFLVFHYVAILFYKWGFPAKIEKLQRTPILGKFFYDLSQCEFCMENHLNFMLGVGYCYFFSPLDGLVDFYIPSNFEGLLYAIMSTALSQIIKSVSK